VEKGGCGQIDRALHEIDVLIASAPLIEPTVRRMKDLLIERHGKEEDFTVTTQTGMLDTLDRIIRKPFMNR